MPRARSTTEIKIKVPYGRPNDINIWFRRASNNEEANYTQNLVYYKVTKRINNLWIAEFRMQGVDGTDTYVKEGNIVKFFAENTLIYKGIIQKVYYDSEYLAVAECKGMSSKLGKITATNDWSSGETTANILTTLVPTAQMTLASGNNNYGTVSIRTEDENNLTVISKMTKMIEYYWYESWGSFPYNTDYFNFKSSMGGTNTYTFNDSGASINIQNIKRDKDRDNLVNYVVIKGYGDGVNQIKTEIYHATDDRTTLSSALTAAATTVAVVDGSVFANGEDIWIGCEKITIGTVSGNSLTGCTRGVAYLGNVETTENLVSGDGYAHDAGIEVWSAEDTTGSPKADSSISDNGVLKKTFVDRTIVSQNALDRIAQKILTKQKDSIDTITLLTDDLIHTLTNVNLGDTVTVNADDTLDTDSGSTFKVNAFIFGFSEEKGEHCILELSNKRAEFVDNIQGTVEESRGHSIYMQGATNIYALSEKENCDSSKALNMRFYLPADAIAINEVLLKFTAQKFRAYSSSSQTATDAGGGTSIEQQTFSVSGGELDSNWDDMDTIAFNSTDTQGAHFFGTVTLNDTPFNALGTPLHFRIKINSTYYPSSDGITVRHTTDDASTTAYAWSQFHIFVPENTASNTYTLQAKTSGGTKDYDINLDAYSISEHSHSITLTFGIYEAAFAASSVTVTAGEEGSESAVTGSPFSVSDGGTYSADITDIIKGITPGNWVNIKFAPDDKVRIESNAYIKIFIKSD